MVEKKGYETFIDMIPHVVKRYQKVTFLLVGDGPLRKKFEDRVKTLGVSEYVRFTGFRKDLANIIKQIDFGVYPLADTAALGPVISAGKVLITKKNSSMDEYILDGETGYLVPEEKPEVYAKYALILLQDEEKLREMENKQKQYVISNFDGVKNMRRLEEVFIDLCRNPKEK
jgi:glycosyltransferase involved in cell wall biosynthesis